MCKVKKMARLLRQENYLVKTTEIELCPNQVKPDPEPSLEREDDLLMDNPPSFPTPPSIPASAPNNPHPRYNLRNLPKKNYKTLDSGTSAVKVRRKPATKLPPSFGWDTDDDVSTDDDEYEDQFGNHFHDQFNDQIDDQLGDLPGDRVDEPAD